MGVRTLFGDVANFKKNLLQFGMKGKPTFSFLFGTEGWCISCKSYLMVQLNCGLKKAFNQHTAFLSRRLDVQGLSTTERRCNQSSNSPSHITSIFEQCLFSLWSCNFKFVYLEGDREEGYQIIAEKTTYD